mgnify:CR=1 FL=1
MQLRKAQKQKAKLRIGISGTSGSGKTYSALLLASGMTSWKKIAVIDTENGSADLYSKLGNYNVITLKAPFSPERYIEAIHECEKENMEVIIIDSITHEWDGNGGCLELVEQVAKASSSKNSYTAWAKITPRHNAFVQSILQSSAHVITTVRRKQDYDMSKDSNGRTVVTKMGLKEVTREGFEYELTLSFNLTQNHLAEASKDRTGLFMDKPEFIISEAIGRNLQEWSEEGVLEPLASESQISTLMQLLKDKGQDELTVLNYYKVNCLEEISFKNAHSMIVKLLEKPNAHEDARSAEKSREKEVKEALGA